MNDIWSLVFFTVLGQTAVGLSLFIALDREGVLEEDRTWTGKAQRQTWAAIVVLCLGTLFSLLHLANPLLSFYSITDLGTSWLSREILFAGLFGASMLVGVLFKIGALRYLAPLVGLAFVYVMSRVYMIPSQPAWNFWITPASFYATALLLGAAGKIVMDAFSARLDYAALRRHLLGWVPMGLAVIAAGRAVILVVQAGSPHYRSMPEEAVHAALLALGAGLCLFLLARGAARRAQEPQAAFPPADSSYTRGIIAGSVLMFILLFAGEIFGRAVMYKNYVWFGM